MGKNSHNNNGFTLVELMISVVVLALITVPLSSLFFSSSELTQRSAEIGDVTLIVENVAEQVEAQDFDAWFAGSPFVPLTLHSNTTPIVGTFVEEDTSTAGVTDYIPTSSAPLATDASYSMHFSNLAGGYYSYDVVVSIDPGDDTTAYGKFNDMEFFSATPLQYVSTQPLNEAQNPDAISTTAFLSAAQNNGYDITNVDAFMARVRVDRTVTTSVNLKDDAGVQTVHAATSYSYVYTFPSAAAGESLTAGVVGTTFAWPGVGDTASVAMTPNEGVPIQEFIDNPPKLYVFMYPFYAPVGSQNHFVLENPDNLVFDYVLVKQQHSTVTTAQESSFSATVDIQSPDLIDVQSNLSQPFVLTNDLPNVTFTHNSTAFTPLTLEPTSKSNKIYNVFIEVFSRDALGNSDYSEGPVYTFSTTKLA